MLGQLFSSMALLFSMIFRIIYFLLVVRIILSWFQVNPYNEIVLILYKITDPILAPLRRLPLRMGPVDFSPIIAFIILNVLQNFVVGTLMHYAAKFG